MIRRRSPRCKRKVTRSRWSRRYRRTPRRSQMPRLVKMKRWAMETKSYQWVIANSTRPDWIRSRRRNQRPRTENLWTLRKRINDLAAASGRTHSCSTTSTWFFRLMIRAQVTLVAWPASKSASKFSTTYSSSLSSLLPSFILSVRVLDLVMSKRSEPSSRKTSSRKRR